MELCFRKKYARLDQLTVDAKKHLNACSRNTNINSVMFIILLLLFLNPYLWVTAVARCSIMSGSDPGRIDGVLNQMPCSPLEPVHPRGAVALSRSL